MPLKFFAYKDLYVSKSFAAQAFFHWLSIALTSLMSTSTGSRPFLQLGSPGFLGIFIMGVGTDLGFEWGFFSDLGAGAVVVALVAFFSVTFVATRFGFFGLASFLSEGDRKTTPKIIRITMAAAAIMPISFFRDFSGGPSAEVDGNCGASTEGGGGSAAGGG